MPGEERKLLSPPFFKRDWSVVTADREVPYIKTKLRSSPLILIEVEICV